MLRRWVGQAERDQSKRPGASSEEQVRMKSLERELRGAALGQRDPVQASAYFVRRLDSRM